MSLTLLDQIAPKANFWTYFFLYKDDCCQKTGTLEEKIREMQQKCEQLFQDYLRASLEEQREIGRRLKDRRFEIFSYLEVPPTIFQLFKRIFGIFFSPYSIEELEMRKQVLTDYICKINQNENYGFCKHNAPVELEMPEFVRYQRDGYYHDWKNSDGTKQSIKIKTVDDLILLRGLITFKKDLANAGVKMVIVDNVKTHLRNLKILPILPDLAVYVDPHLYIAYQTRKIGDKAEFNIIDPPPNEYTSWDTFLEQIVSAYDKINGYKEVKERLDSLLSSYLVKEPPSGPFKDILDIQIYYPADNREGIIDVYLPAQLQKTENGIKFTKDFTKVSFRCPKAIGVDIIVQKIVEIISLGLKVYLDQQELLNIEGLLEGNAKVHLRMITQTGLEEKIINLPSHKLTREKLQNLVQYQRPDLTQLMDMREKANAFKQLCEERGYLYNKEEVTNDRYLIKFEYVPDCPIPNIRYVRTKVTDEGIDVIDEGKVSVLSEEAFQYAQDMEAKIATEKRLQTASLKCSSYYYKFHRVLPGGKQLELCLKGFTSHEDDYEYRTIDLDPEDTREDLEANIKKTIRSYRIYLNKLLNDIEPKTIQVFNEQDVEKQSSSAALIIIKKEAIVFEHPQLLQKKFIKGYSKEDFFREIAHLKNAILLGEAVNKFINNPDNQFSLKAETLIPILPDTPETIILFSRNKIGYFEFSIDTLAYKVYFRNPSDPKRILKFEIDSIAQLKLLKKARKEIENYKLSVEGFLKKSSALTHSQIPAPIEIDKTLISTYYTSANFTNKSAPNYCNPIFGDINISKPIKVQKKIQLFHDNLAHYPHIEALYTNIMDSIQKMPDERDRLQYALEVVAAICNCETKHESAFISIYNTLHADAPISNDKEYDYYERELAVANEMKRGAVVEMANERLVDDSENNQSVHTEKRYVQMLESQGIHIPLSEMNTVRTEEFTVVGNYKNEKDILEGFLNVLNIAHVINVYNERHNQALRTEDLHAVNSQLDLMYSYLETDNADIKEMQATKRKALKDLRETSFEERIRISTELQINNEEKIPHIAFWKAYKKSKINEIETSASHKRKELLDELACKLGFLGYDDNYTLVKISRKGTVAILQAMKFLEKR